MKNAIIFLCLFFLLLVSCGKERKTLIHKSSAQPPKENSMASFMGVKWGENIISFKNSFKYKDQLGSFPQFPQMLHLLNFTLGEIKNLTIIFIFTTKNTQQDFKDASLAGAAIQFSPDQYEALLKVFIEKYGTPTQLEESVLQNAMGAKFNQSVASWIDENIAREIRLSKYGENIDQGLAAFAAWEPKNPQKEKAQVKKTADQL